jgi:8-oxo-dGTP pyrophosphatase MutT (NUDIX family)
MSSNFLDKLSVSLSKEEPRVNGESASVAVVINQKMNVLMIRRANKKGDPWSNQMAFPGGKKEKEDRRYVETAARETFEELGINLWRTSEFIGYMSSFKTHTGKMDVIPSVFHNVKSLRPRPIVEVSSYYWVNLPHLTKHKTKYAFFRKNKLVMNEAFLHGDCIIWGLSYRILVSLLSILDLHG